MTPGIKPAWAHGFEWDPIPQVTHTPIDSNSEFGGLILVTFESLPETSYGSCIYTGEISVDT